MAAGDLFAPCHVAGLALRNRIVMAPMTRSQAPGGVPTAAVAAYYARRAAAGVGLIITEGTGIDRPGALDDPGVPRFWGDDALAGWSAVVEAVHGEGGRIMPQLWHVGAHAGRKASWRDDDPRIESPSGYNAPERPMGHPMDDAAIADTIAAYARAAGEAERLGFDGVEVHGAHGYLIDQFLWTATNLRTDRYGGASIAERSRFAVDVVAAIRAAVSPGFPIVFRFSQFKQQDYSTLLAGTPDELAALLTPIANAGADVFHASQRRFWEPAFAGSSLNLAGWAKAVTGRPTITVGSVGLSGEFQANWKGDVSQPASLDSVRERLDQGEFDLVAVGRALLEDHLWARKAAAGDSAAMRPFTIEALDTYY
ncbi:12-oxophytodienoate reductase [Sphingomonas sp.]|uniref:oxidoreductase n=1 Tax=Sphingomonas sp. TaxID=28214 RepID=UPI002582D77A|nr:12-oxophytodienoate reductase [Sphingomonas sp.]